MLPALALLLVLFVYFLYKQNRQIYLFRADWCGHCRTFVPVYREVRARTNKTMIEYNVDDPTSAVMIERYRVVSFPHVVDNYGFVYRGPRTVDALIKWVS